MRRRGRNRAFLEAVPAFTAAPADSGTSWPDPYRAHAYCERNEDAKAAAPAACGTDNRLACIGTIVGSIRLSRPDLVRRLVRAAVMGTLARSTGARS